MPDVGWDDHTQTCWANSMRTDPSLPGSERWAQIDATSTDALHWCKVSVSGGPRMPQEEHERLSARREKKSAELPVRSYVVTDAAPYTRGLAVREDKSHDSKLITWVAKGEIVQVWLPASLHMQAPKRKFGSLRRTSTMKFGSPSRETSAASTPDSPKPAYTLPTWVMITEPVFHGWINTKPEGKKISGDVSGPYPTPSSLDAVSSRSATGALQLLRRLIVER